MSLTCRASGLGLARGGSVWLDSAFRPGTWPARCRGPRWRFSLVFMSIRVGRAQRGFVDLENRQRRKSFVGSNPTPSAWFSGGLTTLSVFTPRPGSPRRVRLPTRPRPRLLPHTRLFAWVRPNPEPSYRLVQETQAGHGPRRSSKQRCFAKAAAALRHKKLQVLAFQLQRSVPFDS